MSYEKPVPNKDYEGRRQYGMAYLCSSCGHIVRPDEPAVFWDAIYVGQEELENCLEPITRLAAQTNLPSYVQKYGHYAVNLVWHTHCAVYLGGHLTKDGLSDNNVSSTLRKGKEK